ncbi:MAG TPA: PKD domain-containing protein, partial [Dehalococcoidia bacterium]|nr:PKD domain-containing protein [Dehalococcoidia bacterium]
MAPEQIRGEAIGPPADIYALGVLAYRLLAGRPPFVGPIQQVIVAHLQQEPPPLADASPELPEHAIAAVESALAKDAKFRPGSATAFVDALAAPGPQYALHAAAVGDDGPRFVAAAAVRRPQTAVPTATPAGRAPVFRRRSAGRGAVIGSVAIAIAAATLYAANRNGHGSGNRTVALVPQATVPATGVAAAQRTASVAAISPSPSAVHTSAPSSLAGSAPTSATASSTPSPCAVGGASQAGRSVPPPPPPPASSSGAGSATAQAGSATAFSLQLAAPTLAAVGQDATLTAVPSPNAPGDLAYTWSFDDGTTATGGPSVTHAFASPGTYVITVTGVSAGTGVAAHAQTITVVVSATATPAAAASAGVTVTYPAGWNLVAGPEGTMFTQSTSPLYTFTAGASSYAVVPCMQGVHAAQGYWAYFASPATVQLGAGSDGQFTATLPAGQFITIGNPSPDKPVDLQGADLVYTYDPNAGYRATTTLAPGQGAWAYSRAGGVLTLRSR